MSFAIKFTADGFLVEYSFSADLGDFLEIEHPRKILSEDLALNGDKIFSRKSGLEFGSLDTIRDLWVNAFEQNSEGAIALAKGNLNNEELFLMNGFKRMFSAKLVSLVRDWLDNKFIVIYRADALHLIHKLNDPRKKSVYVEKTLNEAATYFGISSNALGYVVEDNSNEAKLCSIFKDAKKGTAIPAELFESYGTIRFVNIFHNDKINVNHAQLIFNTHNPIFLNANLYRRDEIKFVECSDDAYCSTHYSLSDFGTSGKTGVRKTRIT